MTVREALGGPWAAHWLVVVAFLPPSTLLVLLRESATPFPEWWWPLASAGAQHLVTAAVILLGASIARAAHTIVPVPTVLAIWSLGAALRGVVAGVLAEEVAGVDGQILARSAIWAVVSLVWVPPVVYAIAQFERRRLILGAIDITEFELARERPRADASSAEVQRQLRIAIAESLAPALHDLQESLDASRASLDRAAVAELSLRVSTLHDDAADLLESARETPASPPRPVASLRRALDVPPRRPWLTALLVGLATITLVLFDTWIIYGDLAALEVAGSTSAAALVIGAVPAAVARFRPDVLQSTGQRMTGIAALLGIFLATFLMLNSGIDPITWHGLVIVPLLALGLTIATATATAALLLADANLDAERRLAGLQTELVALYDRNEVLMRRERERLAELMHGPVQGRIAACIMALNFHTSGGGGPETGGDLVNAVLDHLRSVSRDLAKITGRASMTAP
jgi:hypothetical protein